MTNAIRLGLTVLAYLIVWMIVTANLTSEGIKSGKLSHAIERP